jgi:hypothetical protein
MLCREHSCAMSVVLQGAKCVIREDSSMKGFGSSPNRLASTDEIIEVIDHLILRE